MIRRRAPWSLVRWARRWRTGTTPEQLGRAEQHGRQQVLPEQRRDGAGVTIEIKRPMKGRVQAYLPRAGKGAGGHREWLKAVLGDRVRPTWTGRSWDVAREHYPSLVEAAVARWGTVRVREEYAVTEQCTGSCNGAKATPEGVWACTCVCGGRNHAGGVPRFGWVEVGDDLLVGSERFWRTFDVTAANLPPKAK